MIIHRFHLPHYQQVAVYFWPILFFELWRVDRWSAATGRQAFVQVDPYGRAWVPLFEGMGRNFAAYDIYTRFYAPRDVEDLCPGFLSGRWSLCPTVSGLTRDLLRRVRKPRGRSRIKSGMVGMRLISSPASVRPP